MGIDVLIPLYDAVQKLCGVPAAHKRLVDHAGIVAGQRVLEIGCGTGNLALLVKRRSQEAEVTGIDPDPKALRRARRKAERDGLRLSLDRGFAEDLPYRDGSFDRVLSALMFHHLDRDAKTRTLIEARRVLRPGGVLCLLDFGGAKVPSDGFMARIAHRNNLLTDNFGDRIPTLMREAGFTAAEEIDHLITKTLGRVTCFTATAPAAAA